MSKIRSDLIIDSSESGKSWISFTNIDSSTTPTTWEPIGVDDDWNLVVIAWGGGSSDDIENNSNVDWATVTDALNNLQDYVDDAVKLTGDQNIDGQKIFTWSLVMDENTTIEVMDETTDMTCYNAPPLIPNFWGDGYRNLWIAIDDDLFLLK